MRRRPARACEPPGDRPTDQGAWSWPERTRGMISLVTLHQPDPSPGAEPERGFVLAVLARGIDAEEELAELRELARTAGVEPVAQLVQQRQRPDARTYVGKGKVDELKA